jgi:DNA mismatch repair protein MutS
LYQRGKNEDFNSHFGHKFYTFTLEDWVYTSDAANDRLNRHFEVKSLKGFGVHQLEYGIIAAGAILHYLDITQHNHIKHISNLARIEEDRFVWLDRFTIRNLELTHPLNEGGRTLLSVIDKTLTPMGQEL